MKFYVAKITKTEKMVYLSCVRYIKENDKYIAIPSSVSVKPEYYQVNENRFPVVVDVKFTKGIGAEVKDYVEKV